MYYWCIDNKEVNSGQCTLLWHLDDLKLPNLIDDVLTAKIDIMHKVSGSKYYPLTFGCGKIHDYLVVTID